MRAVDANDYSGAVILACFRFLSLGRVFYIVVCTAGCWINYLGTHSDLMKKICQEISMDPKIRNDFSVYKMTSSCWSFDFHVEATLDSTNYK